MEIVVNYLAILLASIAAFIVGGIWYSKLAFGKSWMELADLSEETVKEKMVTKIISVFLLSLVMAYMLSHVAHMSINVFGYSAQVAGISSSFAIWFGFVLPVIMGTGLFERRRKELIFINLGNWLVTLLTMGTIIGYFGF